MAAANRGSSLACATALLVAFVLAPASAVDAQEVDRVFVNGTIYTVDRAFSKASAVAVRDGRFIYVGDRAGVHPGHLEDRAGDDDHRG